MATVQFTDVTKIYKTADKKKSVEITALNGLSFTVESGEFCVIVGESGSGKTTLLNLLGGMDTVTSGEILVDGRDIAKLSAKELTLYRRGDVGFVFQFYNLMPNLTALENVELATEICKNALKPAEVLDGVGLSERKANFPAQLSGGEQQRVSIARAIAKNPKILLCDEPTGALDYETGKRILKLLHDLCRKEKKTVIVVTHNRALTAMADRVIHIKNGRVKNCEIIQSPADIENLEW
ncbi:MAG: ABC transporter ATP-binding protein [Firmicutes bacterium]|nr:ABC transporter ATP-binding protein [Bacillota bacterium]